VLPRLVDVHTHIDKGHIWAPRKIPTAPTWAPRTAVMADREANWSRTTWPGAWTLRCAAPFAHGTGALRTHIDSYPKQTPISWPLFAEMARALERPHRVEAVSLYPIDMALNDEPNFRVMVDTVAKHGGLLGGLTIPWRSAERENRCGTRQDLRSRDRQTASDLDFHVDEIDSTKARSLGQIATPRCATSSRSHCRRPLLLRSRSRTTTSARRPSRGSRRRASRSCRCRVQHVSAGPAIRPHAALACVAPCTELAAARVAVMVRATTPAIVYAYGDLDMLEVYRERHASCHFDPRSGRG